MNSRTKKQHLVPRFYLEKFEDANGYVWAYSKNSDPIGRTPSETCVETNFYSPIGEDGKRFDGLEKLLAMIEGEAAPIWEPLCNGEQLSQQERETMAFYLSAQFLRSPANVRAFAEIAGAYAHKLTGMLVQNPEENDRIYDQIETETETETETGKKYTLEEREKMRSFMSSPENYSINVLKSIGLAGMNNLEEFADMFFQMNWFVGTSADHDFITSDNPLIKTTHPSTHRPLTGDGGFSNKTVRVRFPLSPKHLLEMSWMGKERGGPIQIPRQMAKNANVEQAVQAERYLFASKRSDGLKKLSRKRLRDPSVSRISVGSETPEIKVKRKL